MNSMHVTGQGPLRGDLAIPPDKSLSHRAALFAALAKGRSRIRGFLRGEDCLNTVGCVEAMGAAVRWEPNGDLLQYSYNLASGAWDFASRKIGTGWLQDPVVFSGGRGDLFTMDAAGTLFRYHHREDGAFVVARQQVGQGWTEFARVAAAPDGSGAVYGVVK